VSSSSIKEAGEVTSSIKEAGEVTSSIKEAGEVLITGGRENRIRLTKLVQVLVCSIAKHEGPLMEVSFY
jgi:hypothetical protein